MTTYRIEADLLIPGRGQPISSGVVVLDGSAIAFAGPSTEAPLTPGANVVDVPVVMPGLWDCHTHVTGLTGIESGQFMFTDLALRGARAVPDLRAALDAGVTSVRELGGLGIVLAKAVQEGVIDGPEIYAAGAWLSPTGGHADLHEVPLEWVHELASKAGELRQCDGTADCIAATREQLRRNAKVIKVCASGGVFSEVDHPMHQQFTNAELSVIVEIAGLAERAVAAHCHGKAGIMAALEAGVRTIEHGTYLDEECAVAMRELDAILVPTRSVIDALKDMRLPEFAKRKGVAVAAQHEEAVALAIEAGVRIASGSDVVFSIAAGGLTWGAHGREVPLLGQAGLSPLAAIEAATANGPLTLGPQAPSSGVLETGYDADVITLNADPLADLQVLADPANVINVWRSGRHYKGASS